MELRHIRYFLEVAETLNFSRAAERLKVAQPALSKQIRDLEEELGGKLFHRTTAKVALTEMGHYFRGQTRKLMMQLDIAVTAAQQLANGAAGTLRIACDWEAPHLPIAMAARQLREINRHISVQFVEIPSFEHLASLRAHDVDVCFVPSILLGDTTDVDLCSVLTMRMKVILPVGHPLADRSSIELRELRNERWLALDIDSVPGIRVIMSEILQFTPKYGLTTTSLPGVVANVIAGHGIGLVPDRWDLVNHPGMVAVNTDCTPMELFAVTLKAPESPLVRSYMEIFEHLLKSKPPRASRSS